MVISSLQSFEKQASNETFATTFKIWEMLYLETRIRGWKERFFMNNHCK